MERFFINLFDSVVMLEQMFILYTVYNTLFSRISYNLYLRYVYKSWFMTQSIE